MPTDGFLKTANLAHRLLTRVTGGRLGWTMGSMPVLALTTVGRRSGQPRTVLLTSPVRDGDAYVVVASRGGDDQHPAWFLNLSARPQVSVAVQGRPAVPMRAEVADPATRERLWPQVVARFRGYGSYQERTEREIPLVLLHPDPGSPGAP